MTREYPPYVVGGVAVHTYHLVRTLREKGVEVDVASFGNPRQSGNGVFFLEPTSSIISRRNENISRDLRVPLDIVRFTRFTQGLIRERKYDVVHVQEPYVGGLVKHPCKVTTVHDTSYGEMKAIVHSGLTGHNLKRAVFFSTLGYVMEFASIATSNAIIVPSPQVKEELIHVYKARRKRIFVIPNGVEPPKTGEPSRDEARRTLGLPRDKVVIFTVAQHIARKRLDVLLKALAILRERADGFKAVIGGEGPLTPLLKEMARELGLLGDYVEFTGWIPSGKLPLYYRASDVFVVTSEYEAGPMTLLEAGLRGVVLVSSRIPGLPALMREGVEGLRFPPGDPEALASILHRLIEDPSLRAKLSAGARRFAEGLTWDRVAGLTIRVYDEVLQACGS